MPIFCKKTQLLGFFCRFTHEKGEYYEGKGGIREENFSHRVKKVFLTRSKRFFP